MDTSMKWKHVSGEHLNASPNCKISSKMTWFIQSTNNLNHPHTSCSDLLPDWFGTMIIFEQYERVQRRWAPSCIPELLGAHNYSINLPNCLIILIKAIETKNVSAILSNSYKHKSPGLTIKYSLPTITSSSPRHTSVRWSNNDWKHPLCGCNVSKFATAYVRLLGRAGIKLYVLHSNYGSSHVVNISVSYHIGMNRLVNPNEFIQTV